MANNDFLSVMVRDVELVYPKLDQPYKFNTAAKRSEPADARAQGASYSCSWLMSADAAGTLHTQLKAHFEACRPNETFGKVFGFKKIDDNAFQFSAKRNGVNGKGDLAQKPTVIDGQKQPMTDLNIWSGSRGNLRVTAYPVTAPDGTQGVSLLLDVTQITKVVTGGAGGLDDFDEIAPKSDPALDDFSTVKVDDPFASVAAAPAANDLGDEIPF